MNQTGDLASLNYLTQEQLTLLPNLLKLRDALYSPTFRTFLRTVTGCGPLSGVKQDMSINTYKKGCHLLNHDDVIGTRRVSYILYMPLPHYQMWQKEWGGALELYPVRRVEGKDGEEGVLEPEAIPTKSIPPSWNQFIFFEVQPGRSFHSVEEVVVGEGEDGRQRLSISGWFHAIQEGEDGYSPEPEPVEPEPLSSRDQLVRPHPSIHRPNPQIINRLQQASTSTSFQPYTEEPPLPDSGLTPTDISFLSEFLNPVYLQPRTLKALATRFVQESSLELHDFLSSPIASALQPGLRSLDAAHGLGPNRPHPIPPHTAGTGGSTGWQLKGPPHKWRYGILEPTNRAEAVFPLAAQEPEKIIRSLQDQLFGSEPFRRWLAMVSRLSPMRYAVEARRFMPGLGYTLATSEEKEARLDVVLGLTPQVQEVDEKKESGMGKKRKAEEEPARGWQTGEWGGWEVGLFSLVHVSVYEVRADLFYLASVIWLPMTRRMIRPYIGLGLVGRRTRTSRLRLQEPMVPMAMVPVQATATVLPTSITIPTMMRRGLRSTRVLASRWTRMRRMRKTTVHSSLYNLVSTDCFLY